MSYQALYRVWRPQSFIDVVGQEHVTKTLKNALLQQKISHAYLFSGPRGTGKTSAAKILGKAVNCEQMPVADPCNECPSCRGITDGSISDIIEIDAASNNGVEEIRDIREKVKYTPSAVPYKVYIIDEVHMLSIGAFNALLKTLEEPPKHVIFILATTEPHKIPSTIISRCQRFDFKRITASHIVDRMSHIANETGLEYDERALQVIARAAEGGMRDALSLLDQAISFSTGQVTIEDALTVTGFISQQNLGLLARAIAGQNAAEALDLLEQIMMDGKDAGKLAEDLILYFRDLLLFQTAPELENMMERSLLDEEFRSLAEEVSADRIYSYIDLISQAQQDMRFSNHARIYMEVCLVKLCHIQTRSEGSSEQFEELQGKVKKLEREIASLKSRKVPDPEPDAKPAPRKATRSRKDFRVQTGAITKVLDKATRQDLNEVKKHWGALLETLNSRKMVQLAALLHDAEPSAASADSLVIRFKHDIHCQMAMDNETYIQMIEQILEESISKSYRVVCVPDGQWTEIREEFLQMKKQSSEEGKGEEQDPIVSEALKLVGEDLLEVKN